MRHNAIIHTLVGPKPVTKPYLGQKAPTSNIENSRRTPFSRAENLGRILTSANAARSKDGERSTCLTSSCELEGHGFKVFGGQGTTVCSFACSHAGKGVVLLDRPAD